LGVDVQSIAVPNQPIIAAPIARDVVVAGAMSVTSGPRV